MPAARGPPRPADSRVIATPGVYMNYKKKAIAKFLCAPCAPKQDYGLDRDQRRLFRTTNLSR